MCWLLYIINLKVQQYILKDSDGRNVCANCLYDRDAIIGLVNGTISIEE